MDAVLYLKKASQKISNINYTEIKIAEKHSNKKSISKNKQIPNLKKRKSSYPRSPKKHKVLKKTSMQFSKIEKIKSNQMEFTLDLQQANPQIPNEENNNNINAKSKSNSIIIRKKSAIILNKQKIIFLHDPVEFSNEKGQEFMKEKLLNKIEIILSDIDLDQKNYKNACSRLNDIIKNNKNKNTSNRLSIKKNSTLNNFDIKVLNSSPTPSTGRNANSSNSKSNSKTNLVLKKKNKENKDPLSKMLTQEDIYDIMKLLEKTKKNNKKIQRIFQI